MFMDILHPAICLKPVVLVAVVLVVMDPQGLTLQMQLKTLVQVVVDQEPPTTKVVRVLQVLLSSVIKSDQYRPQKQLVVA